jgi:penicillin amidase
MIRRLLRALLVLLVLVLAAGVTAGLWVRSQLRASLPELDGTVRLEGLASPVTVTRDALGVPTVSGASRRDVARATGFLHAQDRFFQMDLARRRAAGELSGLVGAAALDADREIRLHRFRAVAREALTSAGAGWRALLDAYTDGVNSGLAALDGPPFEYLLLRQEPQPWQAEDSVLVVLSMFVTLQLDGMDYESALAVLYDALNPQQADFVAPRGTEWDTPLQGPAFAVPPFPGPTARDPRDGAAARQPRMPPPPAATDGTAASPGLAGEAVIGSNNWAVSGRLTADGRALVANDMHLAVRVPNTWYRAVLEWPDVSEPEGRRRLMGVTLPGVPTVVVGSNRHVAWGFTNAQGDFSDLILLELHPDDPDQYRTPEGWRAFTEHEEVIAVDGEPDHVEPVRWTIWGPVVGPHHQGRRRPQRWGAHDAARLGGAPVPRETAPPVEAA